MPIQQVLGFVEIAICVVAFCVLAGSRVWRDYWALGAFVVVRVLSNGTLLSLRHLVPYLGRSAAYRIYFNVYWPSFAVESVLAVLILYGVLRAAMAPLKGLQIVGSLVFGVATAISVAVSLWICFGLGPHIAGAGMIVAVVSQLQRTLSMLVLCLLVFLTFAMRALGLSYRSRAFGVSLGLGIMATNDLVQASWLMFHPQMSVAYSVFNGVLFCAILSLWTVYFALPEPGRTELAGDSPVRRWNEACVAYSGEVN